MAGVATALFAMNANAVELNPYVGAKLRYVDLSTDVELADTFSVDDKVMGGSIAVGASFNTNNGTVRAELEYNKNEDAEKPHSMTVIGSGVDFEGKFKVETQSVMLNGYYDIKTDTKLTPYVGAGIGFAKTKAMLSALGASDSIDDNRFAWQLGVGVGYMVTDNVTVDAGYRYVDYGDISEEGVDVETTAHELYVGARYSF